MAARSESEPPRLFRGDLPGDLGQVLVTFYVDDESMEIAFRETERDTWGAPIPLEEWPNQ